MHAHTLDERWLQRLVRSHPVYRADQDDDLLQIARITCWRSRQLYHDLSPALAYTFIDKALRQRAGRLARRATNSPPMVSLDAPLAPADEDAPRWEPEDTSEGPENRAIGRALREWLDHEIEQLRPRQREAVLLYFGWFDGCPRSTREVGRLMGVSAARVKQLLAAAYKQLRRACEREGWSPESLLMEITT